MSLMATMRSLFWGFRPQPRGHAFGAGGLWLENVGNQTDVFGNIDNDGVIDLVIRINDGAAFSVADYIATDFLL